MARALFLSSLEKCIDIYVNIFFHFELITRFILYRGEKEHYRLTHTRTHKRKEKKLVANKRNEYTYRIVNAIKEIYTRMQIGNWR